MYKHLSKPITEIRGAQLPVTQVVAVVYYNHARRHDIGWTLREGRAGCYGYGQRREGPHCLWEEVCGQAEEGESDRERKRQRECEGERKYAARACGLWPVAVRMQRAAFRINAAQRWLQITYSGFMVRKNKVSCGR